MNVMFGAGGAAREIDWILADLYARDGTDLRPEMFVVGDDDPAAGSTHVGRPIVAQSDFDARALPARWFAFVAVAAPRVRQRIVAGLRARDGVVFPSVVHPSVIHDRRPGLVTFGEGSIIGAGTVLMTNVSIGPFVYVNVSCSVGHDVRIGAFATLSPGVRISGNVDVGERVFFGTGATTIERVAVGNDAVIGAGAAVIRDLPPAQTYVGVPARAMVRRAPP